jgi:hypothetical protein
MRTTAAIRHLRRPHPLHEAVARRRAVAERERAHVAWLKRFREAQRPFEAMFGTGSELAAAAGALAMDRPAELVFFICDR